MKRRKYSPADKTAAIEALRASITDEQEGPAYRETSRRLGISHTQLRAWWKEATRAPVLQLHTGGEGENASDEDEEADLGALFDLEEADFLRSLAIETRVIGIKARKAESYVAAMDATKEIRKIYRELRAARPTAGLEQLPEEEYRGRLQEEAAAMVDDHLEIFVRTYLERHRLTLAPLGASA